ncbi:very short patch repair endonuclease [Methylobacterium fujisawaense]|uniref:very short patch repair endonuclease n=1 Tax=Methylobacterium fujisawaense TaxID=107400 RepID=UPI00244D7452|nr:very short patch repair endonuclease [Methylobacterium fujisawaense]MDH3032097.1 very short patch repair endonuclease [Methylobacterium fujisawaense]
MTDTRTPEQRRRIMQSVGQKNTKPELAVRKIAHALGYRFRLHRKDLPGRPDLVFPGRKKVVFVHGCFWHGHGCPKGRLPKSRPEFWVPKIEGNKERDHRAEAKLAELGWETLTVWQCEAKNVEAVTAQLVEFLGPPGAAGSLADASATSA